MARSTSPAASRAIRFRPDIEGLRGVAVALVVLDHLRVPGFDGGFIGVDVFFVISGYLITALLVQEYRSSSAVGAGTISIPAFYLRRARRILPAALTVLVAVVVAAGVLLNPIRAARVRHDALWATFFAANLNEIRKATDYFAQSLPLSPLQHYWTLAVEEQFYVVWPALVLLVAVAPWPGGGRRNAWTARLTGLVVAIGVTSLAWGVHATSTDAEAAYFSTFARAWELALGAGVAVVALRVPSLGRGRAWAVSSVGAVLLVAGCVAIGPATPFPGTAALLPTLATAALIAAGLGQHLPMPNRVLTVRPLRFVGRISYSLYLWHWPLIVFAMALYPSWAPTVAGRLSLLVLSVALATASYHLVEQPGRRLTLPVRGGTVPAPRSRRTSTAVAVVVSGLAALLFVVGTVRTTGGGQSTASAAAAPAAPSAASAVASRPYAQELAAWQQSVRAGVALRLLPERLRPVERHVGVVLAPCQDLRLGIFPNARSCRQGDPRSAHVAVLVGDSHAGMWFATLRGALPGRGWLLYPFTRDACGWARGTAAEAPETGDNRDCPALRAATLAYVRRLRPDLVVLSENGVRSEEDMTAALRSYRRAAQRVVVLGHTPAVVQGFAACLEGDADISGCTRSIGSYDRDRTQLEQRVSNESNVAFIDTTPWFCFGEECPIVIRGAPTFPDGSHLSAELAPQLVPLLRAALVEVHAIPRRA